MPEHAPIPIEEFTAAVERLDRDALARFVARLEAAAADDATVDIDPPIVTVREENTRRTVAVDAGEPAASVAATDPDVDAVVVGSAAPAGRDLEGDPAVRTPADLRRQLLYALPPDAAESVAQEWLGLPARAPSYAPSGDGASAEDGADAASESDSGGGGSDTGDHTSVGGREAASQAENRSRTGADSGAPGPPADGAASDGDPRSSSDRTSDGWRVGQAAVVVAVAAIVLGGAGGVVYVAELTPGGDAGAFADVTAVETDGLSEAEVRRRSHGPVDDDTTASTMTPVPGGGGTGMPSAPDTADANRNVQSFPTCDRSSIHVVQIQMNALKHTNDTTNDGIRTVRRFASPRNRRAVETFDAFVRTIRSPTYSPMLSYDSVRYMPIQETDEYAQIQVRTYEDDNVTGQYYFRLRNVDGGEYDGCWMTDAVVRSPPTADTSEGVVSHPEGRPSAS